MKMKHFATAGIISIVLSTGFAKAQNYADVDAIREGRPLREPGRQVNRLPGNLIPNAQLAFDSIGGITRGSSFARMEGMVEQPAFRKNAQIGTDGSLQDPDSIALQAAMEMYKKLMEKEKPTSLEINDVIMAFDNLASIPKEKENEIGRMKIGLTALQDTVSKVESETWLYVKIDGLLKKDTLAREEIADLVDKVARAKDAALQKYLNSNLAALAAKVPENNVEAVKDVKAGGTKPATSLPTAGNASKEKEVLELIVSIKACTAIKQLDALYPLKESMDNVDVNSAYANQMSKLQSAKAKPKALPKADTAAKAPEKVMEILPKEADTNKIVVKEPVADSSKKAVKEQAGVYSAGVAPIDSVLVESGKNGEQAAGKLIEEIGKCANISELDALYDRKKELDDAEVNAAYSNRMGKLQNRR